MKYYLVSPYPCLIKTTSQSFELCEGEQLEIENEPFVFVYPQENFLLPFYVNIENERDSQFVSFIKRDNLSYIVLEKQSHLSTTFKETLNFENKVCHIEINSSKISFDTEKKRYDVFHNHNITNYKIYKIKHCAFVQFEKCTYIFSIKTEKLTSIQNAKVEINNDLVLIEKELCDSSKRIKKIEYEIEENGMKLKKQEFSYNENSRPYKNFVSYKFMEAVKAKDFSRACNMLSKTLVESIDEEKLKVFFGDISCFIFLEINQFLIFSLNTKSFATFSVKNDTIEDISLDSL